MTDEEIRLQCLAMAVSRSDFDPGDIMRLSAEMYDFVKHHDQKDAGVEDPGTDSETATRRIIRSELYRVGLCDPLGNRVHPVDASNAIRDMWADKNGKHF